MVGNHHDGQRHAAGQRREMSLGEHHQTVRHDSDDDRRHAVQHVGGEANQVAEARAAAVFREINSGADSQRNSDHAGDQQNVNRSGDGVRHAAAGFTRRLRNLGQERPVDRTNSLVDQVSEDRAQRQAAPAPPRRSPPPSPGRSNRAAQTLMGASAKSAGSIIFRLGLRHCSSQGCRE